MTWSALDDHIDIDPDVIALTDAAYRLFTLSLPYSRRNGLKGHLRRQDIDNICRLHGIDGSRCTDAYTQLTSTPASGNGLLCIGDDEGGFTIRSYPKYGPPASGSSATRTREYRERRRLAAQAELNGTYVHPVVTNGDGHGDGHVTVTETSRASHDVTAAVTPSSRHSVKVSQRRAPSTRAIHAKSSDPSVVILPSTYETTQNSGDVTVTVPSHDRHGDRHGDRHVTVTVTPRAHDAQTPLTRVNLTSPPPSPPPLSATRFASAAPPIRGGGGDQPPAGTAGTAVLRVFTAWVEASGESEAKLTRTRRALITARLGEYDEATLLDAVTGWQFSPHHAGLNGGGQPWHALETVLAVDPKRNNVERFAKLARDERTKAASKSGAAETARNRAQREAAFEAAVAEAMNRGLDRDQAEAAVRTAAMPQEATP